MRTRYFTPEEANGLITQVRGPMLEMRSFLKELQELAALLDPERDEAALLSDALKTRALDRAEVLRKQIQGLVLGVQELGVQVKDLELGLIDFPALKAGKEVCLCWRLGEEAITHWHGVHEGFQGRKPLTDVSPAEWVWFS